MARRMLLAKAVLTLESTNFADLSDNSRMSTSIVTYPNFPYIFIHSKNRILKIHSHTPSAFWPGTIMRNRSNIFDPTNSDSCSCKSSNRSLCTWPRAPLLVSSRSSYTNVDPIYAFIPKLVCKLAGHLHGSVGRAFIPCSFYNHTTRRLCNGLSSCYICYSDDRVVKR